MPSLLLAGPRCRTLVLSVTTGFAVGVSLMGCARSAPVAQQSSPMRGTAGRQVLNAEDVRGKYDNVLDAIVKLRPEYLSAARTTVGTSNPTAPVAYLNGDRLAEIDMLRRIPAAWVREIRFVRGNVAGVRYGGDHAAGAILVFTDGPAR